MRYVLIAAVVSLALVAGCSKPSGPVTVTPEMEAEQREAEKRASAEEKTMQKQQPKTQNPLGSSVDDQERAHQKQR